MVIKITTDGCTRWRNFMPISVFHVLATDQFHFSSDIKLACIDFMYVKILEFNIYRTKHTYLCWKAAELVNKIWNAKALPTICLTVRLKCNSRPVTRIDEYLPGNSIWSHIIQPPHVIQIDPRCVLMMNLKCRWGEKSFGVGVEGREDQSLFSQYNIKHHSQQCTHLNYH